MRIVATMLSLSLLLAPAASRGEETTTGTLALVTIPGAQADRAWADQLAARLSGQLSDLSPLLPEQSRSELLRRLGDQALPRSEQRAAAAYRALEAFNDLPAAARRLREAADDHLSLLPLLETLDEPARLLIGLATVELALGHQEEVDRALEAEARLDPVLDLDPQETSPRLAAAARTARQVASQEPILSEEQARGLGEHLGVETFVLIQPRPGPEQTAVELYRSSTGRRTARWIVEGRDFGVVADELRSLAGRQPRQAGSLDQDDAEEGVVRFDVAREDLPGTGRERPRRAWYRRWWFWTIVGLAIAGGAAAGVVLGLEQQQPSGNLPLEVHGHW